MPETNNLIAEFIAYNKKHLAPRSQVEYIRDITRLEGWLTVSKDKTLLTATKWDIDSYIRTVPVGKRMTNRKLSVFRTFYSYLFDQETIKVNPALGIKRVKVDRGLPRILNDTELGIVLNEELYPRRPFKSILFSTITHTMYYTGVRVSELIGMSYGDIDTQNRQIRVLGKGSKERLVMFSPSLLNWFHSYEHYRDRHIKQGETAWFISDKGKRLTINQIEAMFRRFRNRTGISVRPHLLRHTFASHGLDRKMTLPEVQELLGHASIASTAIYTHVVPGKLEESYDKAFE